MALLALSAARISDPEVIGDLALASSFRSSRKKKEAA